MMHITQQPEGWTVIDSTGKVALVDEERMPLYCATRAEAKRFCTEAGLYEVREGNPGGWPEGTLVEFSIGDKT